MSDQNIHIKQLFLQVRSFNKTFPLALAAIIKQDDIHIKWLINILSIKTANILLFIYFFLLYIDILKSNLKCYCKKHLYNESLKN